MKISTFHCDITPENGALLAGCGPRIPAVGVHDPLKVCGALLEDSQKQRLLLISCDLLGLDAPFVKKIRKMAGSILQIPSSAVLISCTHTHSGPQTRSIAGCTLDFAYLKQFEKTFRNALKMASCENPTIGLTEHIEDESARYIVLINYDSRNTTNDIDYCLISNNHNAYTK